MSGTAGTRRRRGLRAGGGGVALAASLALAFGTTTACDLQQAVDCARLALQVSTAADRVGEAVATSVILDDDEAFRELADDIDELRDRIENTDVREAADAVVEAAENIEEAIDRGETPDLSPLADATAELTTVCTPTDRDREDSSEE